MPRVLPRTSREPATLVEKWAYFFLEARNLTMIPPSLQHPPLLEALEAARTANFTKEEWDAYIAAGIAIQNERGALSLARKEGHEEGRKEGLSEGRVEGIRVLAQVAKFVIVMISVFMALQQVGVAADIVTTAFTLILGAAALAVSLAFGLGNTGLAGEITRRWYESSRSVKWGRRSTDKVASPPPGQSPPV